MSDASILTNVQVYGLFGHLDYDINFRAKENLCLLYGENGSGKTTILRLIYAALSPNPSEGLRSFIRMVAFRKLCIFTSVGAYIEISRDGAKPGPYHYLVSTSDGSSECEVTDTVSELQKAKESLALSIVLDRLKQLDLDIHFLSDDRLLRSTSPRLASSIEKAAPSRTRRDVDGSVPLLTRTARGESDRTWLNIELTGKQVVDAFRRQVFEQGNIGQINTNGIYLELTKQLVSAWGGESEKAGGGFEDMLAEIDLLQQRSMPLVELKSLSSPSFAEFKQLLNDAPIDRRLDLVRILRPFIESTRARVDALSPIANVISLLIFELNSFLNRKRVTFEIYEGFEIHSESGPIPLAALSSGEKQLFLLLSSAFLSRDSRCIFLIDEPELSLNVYWQRNLPRTLQRLVAGAKTQYVLATHSLEILTEFSDQISTLEDAHATP